MSAALSYESLEDMPEGMRRLVEKQLAKKAERETTQGNVHCGATTPQSASQTAPPTRGALHLIRPCGAPSPQGEGIAGDRKGRPYGPDKGSQWAVWDAGPYNGNGVFP